MRKSIFTYTPDMMRPNCVDCGRPVNQPESGDPTNEWTGTCSEGHTNIYQLEDENTGANEA